MGLSKFVFGLVRWGAICTLGFVVGNVQAKSMSIDLVLTQADAETNHLDTTLTAFAFDKSVRDTNVAIMTGNILTNLDISYDSLTHEVTLYSIGFSGGFIRLNNMSLTLPFELRGRIATYTKGIAGTLVSPLGHSAVAGVSFNAISHKLLLNQGLVTTYGTGMVGGLFDPIRRNLSIDPMEISSRTRGNIYVSLENSDGYQAVYRVNLILPVVYNENFLDREMIMVTFDGRGIIAATGTFILPICPLYSDLAGNDCRIDIADLLAFSEQWLASSDQIHCPLSADLYGEDCYVDLNDFAVLANDWLVQDHP